MKIELSAKTAKAFVKGVENMTDMILLSFSKDGVKTQPLIPTIPPFLIWKFLKNPPI